MNERIKILGVPFDNLTKKEVLETISKWLNENKKLHISTPNPEFLLEAQKNPKFHEILNKTHINIPDGIGILWAATHLHKTSKNKNKLIKILKGLAGLGALIFYQKYCKKIIKERVSGADLMLDICAKSLERGHKIFLLGAKQGIAEKTAEKLKEYFPALNIAGFYAGSPDGKEITEKIDDSGADILFVAFGAPKQDIWIHENLPKLENIKLAMGVGGAFDFISGKIARAPSFLRSLGLEWLFRLIKEPKRIRRIFNAVIKFPYQILKKH